MKFGSKVVRTSVLLLVAGIGLSCEGLNKTVYHNRANQSRCVAEGWWVEGTDPLVLKRQDCVPIARLLYFYPKGPVWPRKAIGLAVIANHLS